MLLAEGFSNSDWIYLAWFFFSDISGWSNVLLIDSTFSSSLDRKIHHHALIF
jgi:hypothetical protein